MPRTRDRIKTNFPILTDTRTRARTSEWLNSVSTIIKWKIYGGNEMNWNEHDLYVFMWIRTMFWHSIWMRIFLSVRLDEDILICTLCIEWISMNAHNFCNNNKQWKKKKKNSFYEFLISHNRNMYTRWALEAWQTCLPTLTHTCSYSRMIRFICWKMMKHSIVNWNVPTHSKTKVKSTATTMRTKTVSSSCGLN